MSGARLYFFFKCLSYSCNDVLLTTSHLTITYLVNKASNTCNILVLKAKKSNHHFRFQVNDYRILWQYVWYSLMIRWKFSCRTVIPVLLIIPGKYLDRALICFGQRSLSRLGQMSVQCQQRTPLLGGGCMITRIIIKICLLKHASDLKQHSVML